MKNRNTKIKILYIVSRLISGGPTNQLFGIIHNLDRQLFEPYILTLSEEPYKSCKEKFIEDGVVVETLGLSKIHYFFLGKRKLYKVVCKISPDFIHTSGMRADSIINKLKLDIPTCSTIHTYVFDDYKLLYGRVAGSIMEYVHSRAIKKMKYPVCCSQSIAKKYSNRYSRNFLAIQNGVDTKRYAAKEKSQIIQMRQKMGLPLNKMIFTVVGSLIERKDPMTIIEAIEQISDKRDYMFLFIGEGVLKEELERHKSEYIHILGYKTNISDFLQVSDFFISASKAEGLPTAVLEAGACGLPMILSDISQHREIFDTKIDGVDFFNCGDVNQLSQLIVSYGKKNKNCSSENISIYIKDKFDSQIMSKKYQSFYQDCLFTGKNVGNIQ